MPHPDGDGLQINPVLQEHAGVDVAQAVEGQALEAVIVCKLPEPL